ncbi:hypothetical protein FZ025_01000 [Xanthomonas hyacinthi]|uniref:DoxX family protein n=1 Tax=Xanthomonas hyacinthi TaxID=56455 RepID=A0A2S7ERT4_9XANT|nr:hypothetical protein [Xanthomonas hyacinthi]KLD72897.1 hypothetical protein Y886_40885 [Xanthomonas hyacinthi DSM 19077]PPU95827.1 hypothetical protein XhyaCFBP1156_17595 [Xanthomonas hyacinthi]QGY75317.1 hypothetical protein FZ025_01000 [Xanthomonas hyacinthi]
MKVRKLSIAFAITAAIAVVAHYFSFKMRYGWYTTDEQAMFLNTGFLILLGVIVLLWAFAPTKLGVALIGIAAVVFPWALRPDTFPAIDFPFATLSLIPIALLVGATHLRLRDKQAAS